jgi:hypothetical protein
MKSRIARCGFLFERRLCLPIRFSDFWLANGRLAQPLLHVTASQFHEKEDV